MLIASFLFSAISSLVFGKTGAVQAGARTEANLPQEQENIMTMACWIGGIVVLICSTAQGALSCGGQIVGTGSGRVRSPGYPQKYPNYASCEWVITTEIGTGMRLYFEHLENKESARARCHDQVSISQLSLSGSVVKKHPFCALSAADLSSRYLTIPATGTTTKVKITFTSDYSRRLTGFSIFYAALCNETVRGSSGTVMSPRYPNIYPKDSICETKIITPPGTRVHLKFEDFDVEDSQLCGSDYISVASSSGGSGIARSGKTWKYCNSNRPTVLSSTNNDMSILFISDSSVQRRGFIAVWSTDNLSETTTVTTLPTTTTVASSAPTTTVVSSAPTTTVVSSAPTTTVASTAPTTFLMTSISSTTTASSSTTRTESSTVVRVAPITTSPNFASLSTLSRNISAVSTVSQPGTVLNEPDNPVYFLVKLRAAYQGRCSTTKSGRKCQSWSASSPHKPNYWPEPHDHNFCRQFLEGDRAPWCYTIDPDKRWEYCDLSQCVEDTPAETTVFPETTDNSVSASYTDAGGRPFGSANSSNDNAVTDPSFRVAGRKGDDDNWLPFVLIGFGSVLLLVFLIAIFLVVLRRKKSASQTVTPGVMYTQNDDDLMDRPRENTYVEIPFISSDELAIRDGNHRSPDDMQRQESAESLDSVEAAKRGIFEEGLRKELAQPYCVADSPQRAATSTSEYPYSLAIDGQSLPVSMSVAMEVEAENPYQQIDYVRAEDVADPKAGSTASDALLTPLPAATTPTSERKQKQGKRMNWFKKKKRTEMISSPSPAKSGRLSESREEEPPLLPPQRQSVSAISVENAVRASPSNSLPDIDLGRLPFVPPKHSSIASVRLSADFASDEVFVDTEPELGSVIHYQSPSSIKEKFGNRLDDDPAIEEVYATATENGLAILSSKTKADENDETKDESFDKKRNAIPDSSFKVSIDPSKIDNSNSRKNTETAYAVPTSPTFDLDNPPSFYDRPSSEKTKPKTFSEQPGESYCSMSLVARPKDVKAAKAAKKAKKRAKSEKPATNGVRESGVYMQMQSQDSIEEIEYQNLSYKLSISE